MFRRSKSEEVANFAGLSYVAALTAVVAAMTDAWEQISWAVIPLHHATPRPAVDIPAAGETHGAAATVHLAVDTPAGGETHGAAEAVHLVEVLGEAQQMEEGEDTEK